MPTVLSKWAPEMKTASAILVFHKKLMLPSMVVSMFIALLGLGISGSFSLKMMGFSYPLIALMFQFFIYELNNPNEYYFYYNLGLSKLLLYASTLAIGLLIGLIFSII
jgi:hypothetical protein